MILNFENFQFLTALTQKVLQAIKKSFEYVHWTIKVERLSRDSPWNSTTVITLLYMYSNFSCVGSHSTECFTPAAAVTWAALGRLSWAMGVSWVMFACITGYGSVINSFLSWELFAPLSRLTYCTYLIHIDMIFLFFYKTKRPMFFDEYTVVSIQGLRFIKWIGCS